MSILIKGVEKPKDCCHCRFLSKTKISSDCKFLTIDYYCDVLAKWKGKTDCPLIELPPHGDLIDRDALMKDGWLSLWKRVDYMGGYAVHDLPLINPSIPVVIESEEK